jgi:hypothetical protein
MYGKCVSGEEWKKGGKEQHSKIGPVNNGEDVAEAWLRSHTRYFSPP